MWRSDGLCVGQVGLAGGLYDIGRLDDILLDLPSHQTRTSSSLSFCTLSDALAWLRV